MRRDTLPVAVSTAEAVPAEPMAAAETMAPTEAVAAAKTMAPTERPVAATEWTAAT